VIQALGSLLLALLFTAFGVGFVRGVVSRPSRISPASRNSTETP
jgi:hypothetical protein